MSETVIFQCDHIGCSFTTPVHILDRDGKIEARAGIAIMGSTNMTEAQIEAQGANPFKDDWYDNFASGIGATEEEAFDALKKSAREIAESIWAF